MVYYAIVYSYLQYCNVVWGNAHDITLRPLCRTLDKIMRIISFSPFNSSNISLIYKKFAILQLDKIHKLELGKILFKYKNDMLPDRFKDHFASISSIHSHSTRSRSRNDFFIPRVRTSLAQNTVKVEGPKCWNSFPENIKALKSFDSFSDSLKFYLV